MKEDTPKHSNDMSTLSPEDVYKNTKKHHRHSAHH